MWSGRLFSRRSASGKSSFRVEAGERTLPSLVDSRRSQIGPNQTVAVEVVHRELVDVHAPREYHRDAAEEHEKEWEEPVMVLEGADRDVALVDPNLAIRDGVRRIRSREMGGPVVSLERPDCPLR